MDSIESKEFNDIFFSPIRMDFPIEENYKDSVPHYVRAAVVQSQITNACVYILDYVEKKFLYLSEKERLLCGYTIGEIEKMGIDYLREILYSDDVELFTGINERGFDFFYKIEPSERHNYWATYDLRIVTKSGNIELYNFKFFPLVIDTKGNIILTMVQIDISTSTQSGNFQIYSIAEKKYYEYNVKKDCFMPVKQRFLNANEKQVLKLFSQGFAIKEVADKMSLELYTVNYYNKTILLKLNVKNMKEAVLIYSQRGDIL